MNQNGSQYAERTEKVRAQICEHGSLRRQCEICERDRRIAELEAINRDLGKDRDSLEAENKRLNERDGNAHIELCYNDGDNPFARLELKHCDFGVADNNYVVELPKGYTLQESTDDQ